MFGVCVFFFSLFFFFKVEMYRSKQYHFRDAFSFPTADFGETGVRSMREGFELIFVTVFASFAADVVIGGR